VPQAAAAPAPAGARINRSQASAHSGSAPAPTQTRFAGQRPPDRAPIRTSSRTKKLVIGGAALVALGAAAYFGIPYVLDLQDKANAKRREAAGKSGGGEMGHIANLYNVLDATDPDRRGGRVVDRGASGPPQHPGAPGAVPIARDGTAGSAPAAALVRPVWTLDPGPESIPEGRANGMVAGTNFLVETARVDPVGSAQVLRLIQGQVTSPDRELLIYLHLKAGETLSGHTVAVSKDDGGSGVPQVKKRWKTNPNLAPQLKTFEKGYAMKLELGQLTNGAITGKIFLALPDPEQSVVAGTFNAGLTPAGPVSMAAPAAPAAPSMPAAQREAFDKRYGKRQ